MEKFNPRPKIALSSLPHFHRRVQSIAVSKPSVNSDSVAHSSLFTIKLNSQGKAQRNKMMFNSNETKNMLLKKKSLHTEHIAFNSFIRELLKRYPIAANKIPTLKHLLGTPPKIATTRECVENKSFFNDLPCTNTGHNKQVVFSNFAINQGVNSVISIRIKSTNSQKNTSLFNKRHKRTFSNIVKIKNNIKNKYSLILKIAIKFQY